MGIILAIALARFQRIKGVIANWRRNVMDMVHDPADDALNRIELCFHPLGEFRCQLTYPRIIGLNLFRCREVILKFPINPCRGGKAPWFSISLRLVRLAALQERFTSTVPGAAVHVAVKIRLPRLSVFMVFPCGSGLKDRLKSTHFLAVCGRLKTLRHNETEDQLRNASADGDLLLKFIPDRGVPCPLLTYNSRQWPGKPTGKADRRKGSKSFS